MIDIVTDPSKKIRYYFRVNSTPLPKTITFLDENGDPYPVNTKTWQVNFKRNPGDTANVLQLLSGSGLTIGVNSITIAPTASQVNIQAREYYIEVRNVTDSQSWYTGVAIGHNGEFDNFETDDLTITVSNAMATRVFQVASTATLTPNVSLYDSFEITAQNGALLIANPTGTIENFGIFPIRIKGDGAITYGDKYRAIDSALPPGLTADKALYLICVNNTTDNFFDTKSSQIL